MQGLLGRYLTVLLFAAAVSSSTALAQMRERYIVPDGGQKRTFSVAHDELHITSAARIPRTQSLQGATTAEATRKAAEKLAAATGEAASIVLYEDGVPRTKFTRRVVTPRIAVALFPG